MSASEIKKIQVQITECRSMIQKYRDIAKEASESVDLEKIKLERLEAELKRLEQSGKQPKVTEHAIIRYVERVYGISQQELTDSIIGNYGEAIRQIQNGEIKTAGGYTLRVKNSVVVTII
jgi:hypothetical protein